MLEKPPQKTIRFFHYGAFLGKNTQHTMTVLRSIFLLCLIGGVAACAGPRPSPAAGDAAALVLDNRDGGSRGGRHLVLAPDGSFQQTVYSDINIEGSERKTAGSYRFSEDRKSLTLVAPSGSTQTLHRVQYHGQIYWVKPGEQERIAAKGEDDLRKNSLRVVGR